MFMSSTTSDPVSSISSSSSELSRKSLSLISSWCLHGLQTR